MANDVSTPSPEQAEMAAEARPIRTLVAGTKAMRAAGEEYLPREPAESIDAYSNRKKRSVLYNATGKTVSDMTGKVFTKPIVYDKVADADLKAWFENVDNAGRHLNVFARDCFYDAMQPGIGFIYVDMPPAVKRADGQPATVADEQKAGIRPYMKWIPLENLIGWKTSTVAGAEVLTQIRIKECESEPDPENPYQDKNVDQIRVVNQGGAWETFREQTGTDGRKSWVSYANGTITQPEIQLFPVYINRDDFMKACPPLAKLAELNIAHWQSSSDQRNILHVARVPILFGAGFTADDKLVVGAAEMIQSSDPTAKLSYVEHSGAAIGAGDKDLQNLELQMQTMGLQLLIDQAGGQTATGEMRDDAKENSPLAMMAGALQDAITQAAQSMARFASKTEPKAGDIVVNKDFGVNGNKADLQFLTQAAIANKLSNETYWAELQRRGTLGDSFDPEVEAVRVDAQVAAAMPPPGEGMDLGAGAGGNGN